MSEYQRYEFMTVDRPLTREQLDKVNKLSSHIEASSTHAVIEYNWGDFKHDPMKVLHDFFDGFLYWANWGAPQLAFRFPHGALPDDLIDVYDFDDFYVSFIRKEDYDILSIHFGDMEAPDQWVDYDLGSLIAIRDELMNGDLRSLYIVWLACNVGMEEEEEEEEEEEDEEEERIIAVGGLPPVPPGFSSLTGAQKALAELFQVPDEVLVAAARHSSAPEPVASDDFAAWIERLPQERRNDYLLRLAQNEPGLGRQLVRELRELGNGRRKATPEGEFVPYSTIFAEGQDIDEERKRKQRQKAEQERLRQMQEVHNRQEDYWRQAGESAARGNASGYDEATKLLVQLRDSAQQFEESQLFNERFQAWVRQHLRRPALLRRLDEQQFTVPEA
jgi:hypothetical protein